MMPRMVGTIIRNFMHRSVTRRYPFEKRPPFAGTRGQILFDAAKCEFCGDCERVCPVRAIVLDTVWEQGDGASEAVWMRVYKPHVCIFCGACVEACFYGALSFAEAHLPPTAQKLSEHERVASW